MAKKKKKDIEELTLVQSPEVLADTSLYFNRELSQLQFNWRVLEEGLEERHPLLERVKFLAIFSSNTDEFFMIRVSGLQRLYVAGIEETQADGILPSELLATIRRELLPQLTMQMNCWHKDILPKLQAEGINVLRYDELKHKQRKLLRRYFEREIFPALTPLAFDPGHPFPHISNLSMNLAVVINDPILGRLFARLKIPKALPRLLRIPEEEALSEYEELGFETVVSNNFVWIEEVVAANLDMLFPGLEVVEVYPFRITRDADMEIEEDEASDLLAAIEEGVVRRQFGSVVRMEIDKHMSEEVRDILMANMNVAPYLVYTADGPIGLADLVELAKIERRDLKDPSFVPYISPSFTSEESIFSVIRRRNILLYHPYDSFLPVVDFLREAARDPDVLAIKQTLYRVGPNAPVVDALREARENGKQVAVLVELKARFDEENNIVWAKALERAGVHVVYGLVGLKTHSKVCMVIRREADGIARYVHMATGNYNSVTARIYTDLGYFTCDPDIGADASDLFNALTGYSRKVTYRKLLVAPERMKAELLQRIEREIEVHRTQGKGWLVFKMNALVDPVCIQALYRASQAGVRVDLQVRSLCCLRPGVPGVSDNIRVTSIVGRFLEHTRIYYFHNGGNEEVWLGSADLMPRNLDRRVEILFPVEDAHLRRTLRDNILLVHLKDNVQARELQPNGTYKWVHAADGEAELNTQLWMIEHRGVWDRYDGQ
ncbi:MAG: polyphosphate kinase 1 [Anaerolineae bacterium]|nr:polyphosphate kinase 1 [Anaerolineae bacterium]